MYLWNKENIIKAVKESFNYRDVLRKLNIPTSGNNTSTLKKKIKKWNIDISHFTFRSQYKKLESRPIEDYLTNKVNISTSRLKEKLISCGLKTWHCENPECNLTEWYGKPIPLELHHINGNPKDNRLENLQLLCPNCHAQTKNYCTKIKLENKIINTCPKCGRQISKNSRHCLKCASENRIKIDVDKETLIDLLNQGYSKTRIGKLYNVTEAAIRKWIKKYNI